MRLLPIVTLCVSLLAPLQAQEVSAPEPAEKPDEKSRFGKFSNIANGPLHPIVKGVVAGGGLGVGLGYDFPTRGRWETKVQTVVTFRRQGFVEFQAPGAVPENLNQGGRYRIAYSLYDDQQFGRFNFTRIDIEARHKFAVFGPHRRLTLHGWMATTEPRSGNTVPFYMQPSLGGGGEVRSVGEDLIGSDGSRATLRGFDNYRFRDLNLMLLQAEYRVPAWGPIDASVFVDAGKVAVRRADLNFTGLERDYGFAVSLMRGPNTVARTEFGFGGGEGMHVKISLGLGDDVLY